MTRVEKFDSGKLLLQICGEEEFLCNWNVQEISNKNWKYAVNIVYNKRDNRLSQIWSNNMLYALQKFLVIKFSVINVREK